MRRKNKNRNQHFFINILGGRNRKKKKICPENVIYLSPIIGDDEKKSMVGKFEPA